MSHSTEEQLKAIGNILLQPPRSLDELLALLDRAEDFLSKVEQSPANSMLTALSSVRKALVADEFVKHLDVDVKVAVASCLSEITRITAPDAPYDDEKMKDIFQLIVSSFENLSDKCSRSYAKRAMILETVSRVRSFVILLDLECDQMIVEMFHHFFKSIRAYHPEHIFASMETIMTLILEESEDISSELLTLLLASVKRNNKEVMPVAKKLGERVSEKCSVKLKPYLTQTVKSLGISLDDYSEVVASMCKETNGTIEHYNKRTNGDQLVSKYVMEETSSEEQNPKVKNLPKSIVSNGVKETGNGGILNGADFIKAEHLDAKLTSKFESGDFGAQNPINSKSKPEQAARKRGRKPNSSNNSIETSGFVDGEKAMEQVPIHQDSQGKDIHDSPGEVATVEAAKPVDKVKETEIHLSPSKASERDAVNVLPLSASGSFLNKSHCKKAGRQKRKKKLIKEKRTSAEAASKTTSDGASDSEAKKRHLIRGESAEISNENQALAGEVTRKDYCGTTSHLKVKSPIRTDKPVDANKKMKDGSSSKKEHGIKRGRVKAGIAKDILESSAKDDANGMAASPRSPRKSTKVEGNLEETPRMTTKRKRTPVTDKASGSIEYGMSLVGSKVKVWWPKDRMYYEGVIASFDSVKLKHKILYGDGDEEILNLKTQRWEIVEDDSVVDGVQLVERATPDTPDEMQMKKVKIDHEASKTYAKTKSSSKSKLKNTATKFGRKSKDGAAAEVNTSSAGGKFEDDTSGKSLADSFKASGKSKDANSKQDTKKTVKSKGKTPQSCNTPTANGRGKMKSNASKGKETDVAMEKTTDSGLMLEIKQGTSKDTSKPPERKTKTGKKLRK